MIPCSGLDLARSVAGMSGVQVATYSALTVGAIPPPPPPPQPFPVPNKPSRFCGRKTACLLTYLLTSINPQSALLPPFGHHLQKSVEKKSFKLPGPKTKSFVT